MAMKDLVAGECGGANALVKLTSHLHQDQSFIQEGFSRENFLPLNDIDQSYGKTNDFVQEFLQEQQNVASLEHSAPKTFHMASLIQEMQELEKNIAPPQTGPRIADLTNSENWAKDFLNGADVPDQLVNFSIDGLKFAGEYLDDGIHSSRNSPSRLQDDALVKFDLSQTAKEIIDSVDDPKIYETEFMSFVRKIRDGDIVAENEKLIDGTGSQEMVSEFLKDQGHVKDHSGKSWVDDFSTQELDEEMLENASSDYWQKLQQDWENLVKQDPEQHPWLSQYDELNDSYKEYNFVTENEMAGQPNAFEEGKKCLENHDLSSAILLFEASVQNDPKHTQAWYHLGKAQAENEQDAAAISALRRCLDLDDQNLECIAALAVSYTNESFQVQACYMLYNWIKYNPKYSQLITKPLETSYFGNHNTFTSSIMSKKLHEEVSNLFINAARMKPEDVDPDVQSCLGVLFNLSNEYEKAADCFRSALQKTPHDALLWNRLGATLANGDRSEEAIDAYHQALKLSPGFIRCRYNLGVSCINLRSYREAVEHLLTSLNIQASARSSSQNSSKSTMSDNIWSTLKLVMTFLDRSDIYHLIDSRDLDTINSNFFPPKS